MRIPIGLTLREAQRIFVRGTLTACKENKAKAAKVLGISRRTLYTKSAEGPTPQSCAYGSLWLAMRVLNRPMVEAEALIDRGVITITPRGFEIEIGGGHGKAV